ncbi:MAG: mechanosensitive ion channel domain-containing protein [Acidobacteriota bacterium]
MNPQRAAEWLADLPTRLTTSALLELAVWLATALVVAVAVRFVRRWVDREIEDVNRRHRVRKAVGYAGVFLVLLVGLVLLAGTSLQLTAVLGILAAGAAVALQDTAKNAVGWIYLTARSEVTPGSRVEVAGVVGEVIDIGFMKTTLLEVGNLVQGRQSSGRIANIPNASFVNEPVLLSPAFSQHVWHESSYLLTYESDWERGAELLESLGREAQADLAEGAERGFREMERRFAFKHGPLTPIVYVRAEDSGILLILRCLTHIRQRRGAEDQVTRAFLREVERDDRLEIAYPTWRIYRRGEEEGGGPPGAAGTGSFDGPRSGSTNPRGEA